MNWCMADAIMGAVEKWTSILWGAMCVKKAKISHMMVCVITYHKCDSPYGYVDIHIIYVDLHMHM